MIIIANRASFGHNLRRMRKERKLSQKALASSVGVSVYTLRGWEQCVLELRLDEGRLKRLCSALGITIDALFCEEMQE